IRPRCCIHLPWCPIAEMRDLADRAEAAVYDSIAAADHFFMRSPMESPDDPLLECFSLLAALAMITRRVKLAQLVVCNSFRHPALTAKAATTLDHVSGGRLELGLGAGWFREEYDALGIEYPAPRVRIAQLRGAIR